MRSLIYLLVLKVLLVVVLAFLLVSMFARGACRAADPTAAAVFVHYGSWAGSGTVVACEGGRSLVVTNGHVCPAPGAAVTVDCGGKTYPGRCLAASHPEPGRFPSARCERGPDLSLLVVDAELPAAEVADAEPAPGAEVRQWGMRGAKAGVALGCRGWADPSTGVPMWEDTIQCQSGDSGSGVFCRGRLVAVTFGGGCVPLAHVRAFLREKAAAAFPRLAGRMGAPCTNCSPNTACKPGCAAGACPCNPKEAPKPMPGKAAEKITYAKARELAAETTQGFFVLAVRVPAPGPSEHYGAPVYACDDAPPTVRPGVYQCSAGADGLPRFWREDWRDTARPAVYLVDQLPRPTRPMLLYPFGGVTGGTCPGGTCPRR